MRATLAISPYENWSHRGYNNEPGFFSSFHWGIGCGLTTVEILFQKYGDIFVNTDGGFAYGLNGCTVTNYQKENHTITLEVESNIHFVEPFKLAFRGKTGDHVQVVVNGERLGEYSANELEKGIFWYFKNLT